MRNLNKIEWIALLLSILFVMLLNSCTNENSIYTLKPIDNKSELIEKMGKDEDKFNIELLNFKVGDTVLICDDNITTQYIVHKIITN